MSLYLKIHQVCVRRTFVCCLNFYKHNNPMHNEKHVFDQANRSLRLAVLLLLVVLYTTINMIFGSCALRSTVSIENAITIPIVGLLSATWLIEVVASLGCGCLLSTCCGNMKLHMYIFVGVHTVSCRFQFPNRRHIYCICMPCAYIYLMHYDVLLLIEHSCTEIVFRNDEHTTRHNTND